MGRGLAFYAITRRTFVEIERGGMLVDNIGTNEMFDIDEQLDERWAARVQCAVGGTRHPDILVGHGRVTTDTDESVAVQSQR